MFLYHQLIAYSGPEEGKYHYFIKIIGTDFKKNVEIWRRAPTVGVATAIAVIKTYENDNLSLNFFRYMQYAEKAFSWKIADQLIWYEKYIPEYQGVKPGLSKYINLM